MSAPPGSTERIARNATFKILVQATRLASLLLVIATARVLGPVEFGKFTFAYALATVLGVALEFGVWPVLTRSVARDPASAADQWAAATTLKLGLLGLVGPFYLVAPLVAQRPWDTTAAVWLLGLAIALQGFVENGVAVFTGMQRLDQELLARLVEKSVLVTVGFAALGLGAGLLGVILAFVLAAVVSLAFGIWRIHRQLTPLRRWWRPAAARALARELAPVAHAQFLGVATSRLAPVAVTLIAGDRAAGYFGAAFRVYDVLAIVPVSLVAAVYPELARTPPGHPRFRAITTQSVEALLLVAWPVALGLAVGAPWLTSWIYGSGYGPAAPVLAVLGAAVACSMLQQFLGFTLLALDRPGQVRAIAGLAFLTGLLAIPGAVLAGGAVGGAGAVLLVEGVTVAASLWTLRGAAGWPLGRGAAKGLGAAAVGAAVASLLPLGPGRLVGALAAYALGLAVLRPLPGSVCLRLLRGALGRSGPPSAAGVR